jgi:hypothetical protein
VLELGCGISGIIALSLAHLIKSYTLTDQPYVMKFLKNNLEENRLETKNRKVQSKSKKSPIHTTSNITAKTLDWETDEVASALAGSSVHEDGSFDALIACDCIYNDALIPPLVQTCADVCRLRQKGSQESGALPTLCIIAQQLRSAEIFEAWLKTFHEQFRVWRLPDSALSRELGEDTGFVVHVGVLR